MKYFLCFAAFLALMSCNSSGEDHNTSHTNEKPQIASSDNSRRTQISVTITGGAHAGTYKAGSVESGCSMGLTGEKSFGLQYSETGKGTNELSSVQMIVDDYEAAKKGTVHFNVMFGFGSLISGVSYPIDADNKNGTGKLVIKESGGDKIATIEGTTKDGVGIRAVVTCKTVQKMVDGQLKEE